MSNPSGGYRDHPEDPDPSHDDDSAFELPHRDPIVNPAKPSPPIGKYMPDPEEQKWDDDASFHSEDTRRDSKSSSPLAFFASLARRTKWTIAVVSVIIVLKMTSKSTRIKESPLEMHSEPVGLVKEVEDTPAVDVDITEFCGECHWGMGTSCDGRVDWMLKKHGTPVDEGKAIVLRAGQCDAEAKKEYEEKMAKEIIPVYPCRNSTEDEGGHGVENFCGYCVWKDTQFDCFTRVKYLMDHYGDAELTAKKNLIDGGECIIPDDLKEQEEKAAELGLEEWCGHCSWGPHHCDTKADWYAGDDPVLRVQKQKEIMESGHCKKAPLCDEVNKDAND